MILALFQVITLYGGPLYLLSYLMGFVSHTRLMISLLRKIWTFNFLLVLLAALVVSSLFTTASVFINAGVCSILSRVGTAIPTHCNPSPFEPAPPTPWPWDGELRRTPGSLPARDPAPDLAPDPAPS